jgi:hypothetical protein
MHQFLERHNLPKLTQAEIDNLSRTTSTNEIELISNSIITFQNRKRLAQIGLLVNATKYLKKKLNHSL